MKNTCPAIESVMSPVIASDATQSRIESTLKILVVVLAFVIPISTSLSSITLMLFLLCWIYADNLKERICQIMRSPIAQATCLFFGLCIIGALYAGYTHDTIPWQDRLHSLGKEAKFLIILLCLPVLQDPKTRRYAFWSFIAAVSLTLLLGYVRYFTSVPIPSRFNGPYVFRDSIHTSFILCFGLFTVAQYLLKPHVKHSGSRTTRLLLYIVTASSIFYLFFMGHGRAGYIIFSALSILFVIQLYRQTQIRVKGIVLSISLLAMLFLAANAYSPKFQVRTTAIKTDILQYKAGITDSSLGSRLEFLKNSLLLIKAHPIIGYGTGSFKSVYQHFAQSRQQQISDNPHNEYIRLTLQLGILGCLVLAYWLLVALKERHTLPQFEKNCAEGMLLAMGLGCLANSWITDFTSGYLFVYWIAFALSAGFPHKSPEKLSVIVTTYNWPAALRTVLEALISQKSPVPYEIIIADDGSRKETADLIKNYKALKNQNAAKLSPNLMAIKHIWHPDDGFRAAAIRNKAILDVSGDYVIFVDGDSVPRSNFLRRHYRLAETGFFVAGNRVLLSKQFTETVLAAESPIHTWSLARWLLLRLKGACNRLSSLFSIPLGLLRFTKTKQWKGAKGCNLAVWKSDLFQVNGWDEQFSGWGYEDSDLVIRLIRSGIKRKEGRYLVPILHLWHKENDRSLEPQNWGKLQDSFTHASFLANIGLKENHGIS